MEKFDIKEAWLVKIKQNIDNEQENLNPKDRKFFNLDILLDLARFTQKYSYNCETCKANKDLIMEMSSSLSGKINTLEGRREISKKLDQLTTHLRKTHKMYIRRFMSSLWAVIGLFVGLLLGLLIGYLTANMKFYILISGSAGLFIGTIIGGIKEKILKNNGQIYGLF